MACMISSSHPNSVIHDQGKEFVGFHFQQMLQRNGVRSQPTTVKNPQANTLGTLSTLNPPAGFDTARHGLNPDGTHLPHKWTFDHYLF
jgi:hypothetical protein